MLMMERKECCLCGKLRYLNKWGVCPTCMDSKTTIASIKKVKTEDAKGELR